MYKRILFLTASIFLVGALASSHPTAETCWKSYTTTDIGTDRYYTVQGTSGLYYEYIESNGRADLQRGGSSYFGGIPDECQAVPQPDMLLLVHP